MWVYEFGFQEVVGSCKEELDHRTKYKEGETVFYSWGEIVEIRS